MDGLSELGAIGIRLQRTQNAINEVCAFLLALLVDYDKATSSGHIAT
jgi:hypothetical protein